MTRNAVGTVGDVTVRPVVQPALWATRSVTGAVNSVTRPLTQGLVGGLNAVTLGPLASLAKLGANAAQEARTSVRDAVSA